MTIKLGNIIVYSAALFLWGCGYIPQIPQFLSLLCLIMLFSNYAESCLIKLFYAEHNLATILNTLSIDEVKDLDKIEDFNVQDEDIALKKWKKNAILLKQFNNELPEQITKNITKVCHSSRVNLAVFEIKNNRNAIIIGDFPFEISIKQLRAAYAHEIGHAILGHLGPFSLPTQLSLFNRNVISTLPFTFLSCFIEVVCSSTEKTIPGLILPFMPLLLLVTIIKLHSEFSQSLEFAADEISYLLTKDAPAFISFLKSYPAPAQPLTTMNHIAACINNLFPTHPSDDARAEAIKIIEGKHANKPSHEDIALMNKKQGSGFNEAFRFFHGLKADCKDTVEAPKRSASNLPASTPYQRLV